MKIDDIVVGLKRIRARAEVSGEADFWVTANDAINLLDQISCDDCVRREEAISIAEQGQIHGFEWEIKKLCTLPSVVSSTKALEQAETHEDTTCKLVRELPYDYDIHDIARTVNELVGVVNKLLEQQSEGEKHDK